MGVGLSIDAHPPPRPSPTTGGGRKPSAGCDTLMPVPGGYGRGAKDEPMMDFLTLRIALRALARNKMRSGLTILGLVIGIAAVSTMVSLGQSASGLVQNQFEQLGTNMIVVHPGARRRDGISRGNTITLTARDADAIAR